jgi:hypothetical protein
MRLGRIGCAVARIADKFKNEEMMSYRLWIDESIHTCVDLKSDVAYMSESEVLER